MVEGRKTCMVMYTHELLDLLHEHSANLGYTHLGYIISISSLSNLGQWIVEFLRDDA